MDESTSLPVLEQLKKYVKSVLHGTNAQMSHNEVWRYTDAVESKQGVKQQLLLRIASTSVGLLASFAVSYFAIKWLVNVMDPTYKQKQEAQKKAEMLMKKIGVPNTKLSEFELCIASNLVDPLSMVVSWENIGGLNDVIQEIMETVILPFRRRDLFADSALLQPPKGVLLYGPPGCGKTMIAKATAKAAGARFINLQVSSLLDKWYGESQKRAEAVFSLALKIQPTIIFIDEIDSFLRSRSSTDHEATSMVKTQFMSFWDGLLTDPNCQVMIMGATNRPQDIDPAILRRMPSKFKIGLPNSTQRFAILKIILENEPISEDVDLAEMAAQTECFCGSDLRELCRNAAIYRIRDHILNENNTDLESPQQIRQISYMDFQMALQKMKVASYASIQQVDLD